MFAPLFVYSYLTASLATASRRRSEQGASFTEYVVLLAAIVAVVTAGVIVLGNAINAKLAAMTPL